MAQSHHAESAVAAAPIAASLESQAPGLLARLNIASLSVAVLEEGRMVYTQAWGQASPGQAATSNTLYNVASLAKPVSAEVAMRLIATGRIGLDEAMSPYWIDPDLAEDPRASRLTPRLVMSHRTGLPNWRADDGGVLKFDREPGEAFGYSGEGFEWLARFIERKTGTPFEELAQALVFAPSGMKDTAYTRRSWFSGRLAVPYDADTTALSPQIAENYVASDDLITTPTDYAHFMIGVLNQQGLTPELYRERQTIQTARPGPACATDAATVCASEDGFGLGWESVLIDGRRVLMHTGMDEGTFTFAYFELDAGKGLVLFTNSSNGWKAVLPVLQLTNADKGFIQHLRRAIS
ncbi:serine hydrolase domain-containing protein [Brevundimonas sp. DWR2-3-1b1]|uniref:serine hydrolase domain-containing protein n=1 Tax=unclassified Brevundimonas TaxID=2622653 RepID=UPI003CEECDB8